MMSIIHKLKLRAMARSRHHKLEHFYSVCPEKSKILDVGVSSESKTKKLPQRNIFLKSFRHQNEYYTGLGIEDLSGTEQLFPGKKFVQYPGRFMPFGNKEFDWVFSNAVIEHVGSDADKINFVNEMLRVGKDVFFTTPNKYFPIESHTNAFFVHWHNKSFYNWCANNRPYYNSNNLDLFSINKLKRIMEKTNAATYTIYKNKIFGITTTFTVICSDLRYLPNYLNREAQS